MKQKWKLNDRVEYYVLRGGKRQYRLGYVKAYRMTWLGMRYFVCVADRTREIDIVRSRQIFCLVPKRECGTVKKEYGDE